MALIGFLLGRARPLPLCLVQASVEGTWGRHSWPGSSLVAASLQLASGPRQVANLPPQGSYPEHSATAVRTVARLPSSLCSAWYGICKAQDSKVGHELVRG